VRLPLYFGIQKIAGNLFGHCEVIAIVGCRYLPSLRYVTTSVEVF
jgi:hypothetical protein